MKIASGGLENPSVILKVTDVPNGTMLQTSSSCHHDDGHSTSYERTGRRILPIETVRAQARSHLCLPFPLAAKGQGNRCLLSTVPLVLKYRCECRWVVLKIGDAVFFAEKHSVQ